MNSKIAQNIASARGDMSQTEVARRMVARGHKWTQSTISAIERGDRDIKLTEATDLAGVLGVPLDYLARDAKDPKVIAERRLNSEYVALRAALVALDTDLRASIRSTLDLEKRIANYEQVAADQQSETFKDAKAHVGGRRGIWARLGSAVTYALDIDWPDDETLLKVLGYPGAAPEELTLTELANQTQDD